MKTGVVDCATQNCCCWPRELSPRRPSTLFVVVGGDSRASYMLRYDLGEARW